MHFTEEQQQAIYETGHNIIVSAGAGSGKTAVLTERIIEKLKSGISLSELVVLTFTNAAAFEMKERVRKKLVKEAEAGNVALASQLDLLDTADICTFDSYSLALVKKYHYLLGLEKDVNYAFKEVKAPDGYSINEDNAEIQWSEVPADLANSVTGTASMVDTKLASLPGAGGIGTTIFTIGGCAIMIAAAALYFVNRRKSEEN